MIAGDVRFNGHPGLDVYRTARGTIRKVATDERARGGVMREAAALELLGGRRAPRLLALSADGTVLEETDVGVHRPPAPGEFVQVRRDLTEILALLRSVGLRHADPTGVNFVWDGVRLSVVDFEDSHPLGSPPPTVKQMLRDPVLAMAALAELGDDNHFAPRWTAMLAALGASDVSPEGSPLAGRSLLDLGCHDGAFVELAHAEGMRATGVDVDAEIVRANLGRAERFPGSATGGGLPRYVVQDLATYLANEGGADVILMCSVWPYLLSRWGEIPARRRRRRGIAIIRSALERCSTLFFETQIAGDGPGPAFLVEQEDVRALLVEAGAVRVERIVEVDVGPSRPEARRVVWIAER